MAFREKNLYLPFFAAFLAAVAVFSLAIGRLPLKISEILGVLAAKAFPFLPTKQSWDAGAETVVLAVRLPRILTAALVGANLSASGTVYQSAFRNPMASPDVLGACAGAAFGAALAIFLRLPSAAVAPAAFAFGVATIILVLFVAQKAKGDALTNLILAGIVVGSLFSSATSLVKLAADSDEQLPAITFWLMGSVANASLEGFVRLLIPSAAGLAGILIFASRLDLLTLDDDEARSMGLSTRRARTFFLCLATLISSASVAESGTIGWVGIAVPHAARRIVGNHNKVLLPASALLGAAFLVLIDDIARTAATMEIPLGVLTAFVGAPIFLRVISKRRGRL